MRRVCTCTVIPGKDTCKGFEAYTPFFIPISPRDHPSRRVLNRNTVDAFRDFAAVRLGKVKFCEVVANKGNKQPEQSAKLIDRPTAFHRTHGLGELKFAGLGLLLGCLGSN